MYVICSKSAKTYKNTDIVIELKVLSAKRI